VLSRSSKRIDPRTTRLKRTDGSLKGWHVREMTRDGRGPYSGVHSLFVNATKAHT
jgi:hypothetical protein